MKVYKRFENATFENFEIHNEEEKRLVEILKEAPSLKNNVIITGGVGIGKTHLMYAILNKFCEKKDGYYLSKEISIVSIKEIIDIIRQTWRKDADRYDMDALDNLKSVPLLIIEEVGVQYGSDSERIELFDIFNDRYNNMLPTIITSNFNEGQIKSTLGLRSYDRLFGGAYIFNLTGKSRRNRW